LKKVNSILWGIVLIAIGAVFALNALNITNISIFFDGWWTLFIIIPSFIGLFTEQDKSGNLTALAVGIILLLCCQDIISFGTFFKLIIPVIIVIAGIKMVFKGIFGNKANEMFAKMKEEGKEPKVCCATFSGSNIKYDGEIFEGGDYTSVFGGIKCDLRSAIIEKDCAIRVCAIFGGIDILLPENVNVKVNATGIFGGVSDKTVHKTNAPTVYISGICMFGGVDIK